MLEKLSKGWRSRLTAARPRHSSTQPSVSTQRRRRSSLPCERRPRRDSERAFTRGFRGSICPYPSHFRNPFSAVPENDLFGTLESLQVASRFYRDEDIPSKTAYDL